jgi:hypothetical protein
MKKVHLIAIVPVLLLTVGSIFANRVEPYMFGMPFLLFYILLSVILTSIFMSILYALDPVNKEEVD